MARKKKQSERRAHTSITIPPELLAAMREYAKRNPDVNWGEIACKAFAAKVSQSPVVTGIHAMPFSIPG